MSPPRVAIITVTYNRSQLLVRAIESVLSQDYPDLRLLVVDDGSTDGTTDVLEHYQDDPRVEVVRHQTNRGVMAARNTALSLLSDDVTFFGYVDSDDMLLPGAVRAMVEAIEKRGDRYSMVCAWSQDAATGLPDGRFPLASGELAFDDYASGRLSGDFMELVRRDLAEGLRYNDKAGGGEGVLLAQLLRMRPALLIADVVQLTDRSGKDRVSRVRYDPAYAEGQMWAKQYMVDAIGVDIRRRYPKRYAGLLADLARWAAAAGDGRRARIASREAIRINPSLRTMMIACMALAPAWMAREGIRALARLRALRAPPRAHL